MPQLIRTRKEILREEKKDIYIIIFSKVGLLDQLTPPGKKTLLRWFKQNLPEVFIEDVGGDEDLWAALGGEIRVDFDEERLATFVAAWENSSRTARPRKH